MKTDSTPPTAHTLRTALHILAACAGIVAIYLLSLGPALRIVDVPARRLGLFDSMAPVYINRIAYGTYRPVATVKGLLPSWYWNYLMWWIKDTNLMPMVGDSTPIPPLDFDK
jgi:hypothetical protein